MNAFAELRRGLHRWTARHPGAELDLTPGAVDDWGGPDVGSIALRGAGDSWLRYLPSGMSRDGLRSALRPLLDLPVEVVLVSHGQPVLEGGREAIAEALKA